LARLVPWIKCGPRCTRWQGGISNFRSPRTADGRRRSPALIRILPSFASLPSVQLCSALPKAPATSRICSAVNSG
jgi:hypothetical protein